jgi:hypothetical protein
MMEPFCGSVQANVKRALCSLEETRASSNGQHTSARKRKEKPKPRVALAAFYSQPFFRLISPQFQVILVKAHFVIEHFVLW